MIVAITLLFLLGAVSGNDGSGSAAAPYDTIVVGLGPAGCTAAATLARAGRRVLGLEAQGRLGGRINTVPFGDGIVELGAEWIHGTYPSRVYDAAVENNVSLVSQDLSFTIYRSDGTLADRELVTELMTFALGVASDPPEVPEPLGQYTTKRLMRYIEEKHPVLLVEKEFLDEFLHFMRLIIESSEGTNWKEVTTECKYEDIEGDQHMSWHRHGYKTLIDILLNTYNNGPGYPTLETKLNTEVTQISWSRAPPAPVRVTCRDGSTYAARNVIVTVSLGVLQERHSTLFTPMLPQKKIDVIGNRSMGVMDKIALSFDRPWWPKNTSFFGFLWKADNQIKMDSDDYWVTQIFGTSFSRGSSNTMTFWISGDSAKLVETLPDNIVKTKIMELLRRFVGKNITIPEPIAMIRSTWYSNPFTRGTYTYDNLLNPQFPTARDDLSEPLLDADGEPRVLFAGEETNTLHFATVHGATETGYREAMRLLSKNKIDINDVDLKT